MNFKLWPKDATTVVEKAAYVMMKVFAPALYVFLQFSAWGIFKNDYQQNVAAAGSGWHVLGFVLTVASVGWIYGMATDSKRISKSDLGNYFIAFVLMGFSLLAYMGFNI